MNELSAKRYQKFINHSIKGVMLHFDLENYAYYLGLCNFAELQCKRYESESKALIKNVNAGAVKFETMFTPQGDVRPDIHIYPQDALITSNCKLSTQFRQKSLKSMMEDWINWEEQTIELLTKLEHESFEDKCDMEHFYACQIEEVEKELCLAKELNLKLSAIEYYIFTDSEEIIGELLKGSE